MAIRGETSTDERATSVLIIEDEENHVELIRRAFDASGKNFRISYADTLKDAKDFLNHNSPDIVIADIILPDGESMDLLERETGKSLEYPFIVMTSHGGEEVAVRAMKAGALDYVVKSDTAFLDMPRTAERALREWRLIFDRKMAERTTKRLATAIEQAADAILITDAEGIIQYVNPSFEKMTGWGRDELIGEKPTVFKSGRQSAEFYRLMWSAIKRGETWTGKLFNRRKDGSVYEEEMTISPIMNEAGGTENFVAVKRDISRESFLARARDYFVSVTSHELRTPLFKLQLVKSLLDEMSVSGSTSQKLEMARLAMTDSFDNLSRIASATAILSDLSQDSSKLTPQYFSLSHVLGECLERARIKAEKSGRRVEINDPPNKCKVVMSGNPAMIHRALEEIISNAVKYTPEGKSVSVTCAQDGVNATITIKDDGVGISGERLSELFEPFFSLEDPLFHSSGRYKFKGGGLGLGLKIARMIVESHGGKITISSAGENMGTSVTALLPIVKNEIIQGCEVPRQ